MLYVFTVISASPSSQTAGKAGIPLLRGFPGGSDSKESACNAGDPGSIPESGRSPGEEKGNPLQYPCLENSMDRGVWWAIVHGVPKSWTLLSDFHFHSHEKNMENHFLLSTIMLASHTSYLHRYGLIKPTISKCFPSYAVQKEEFLPIWRLFKFFGLFHMD